ncbi:ferredoxin [Actinosynnema sp. CS-041913]|uniref:ferredoxin n=1 Tax=Actinosynnema sp. CS-041913 TaxID=3239917 RepID=UPI003D8C106C
MVHVRVDADRCNGHGLCQLTAPRVFEVNPATGFNEAGEFDVAEGLREAVVTGVRACPEQAITASD